MPTALNFSTEEVLAHFPNKVSKAIVEYANETVFKFSRYIFTKREGKKQYGYCTHCKSEFSTSGLTHNGETECPKCKSKCTIKASGMRRSRMIDEAYFVYYEKSVIDPNVIVARGIYAVRDYRYDYKKVETQFETNALYVFKIGISMSMRRYIYYSDQYGECIVGHWERCKTVFSEASRDHISNIQTCCSYESIKEAVKDTPFRWSCYESYLTRIPYIREDDMVKFFDLYAKYPCIEYLTKLGLKKLVEDKLYGNRTYGAINWRGTNLLKVLKLTKKELKEIKQQNINITFLTLKLYQIGKKDGSNYCIAEAYELEKEVYNYYYFSDLETVLKYTTLRKAINYLNKQHKKLKKHFYNKTSALTSWKDYIFDCITLEMDLADDKVLYPRDLHAAHQNTIKQVKIKADEKLNEEIKKRLKYLNKYSFEYQDLIIRPAESSNELIAEGKALSHCVGTYADRYAKGQTNIFLIRKASKPDKPYYTVEIRKDEIIQIRGKNNCNPNKEVKSFIEAFKEEKLNSKESKRKTKVAVPA